MSVGKSLEIERKIKGYCTQNSLAIALDISYPTISRWENYASAISSDKLELRAQFGIDIMYILTGKTGQLRRFLPILMIKISTT